MSTNRETERDYVVGLVTASLVGEGNPLQACYGYQDVSDWPGKKSPVLIISSAGTEPIKTGAGSEGYSTRFYFYADSFVIFSDGDWSEANCEDRLDLIEVGFRALLQGASDSKKKYRFDGRSTTGSGVVSGTEYRRERIPFSVEIKKA